MMTNAMYDQDLNEAVDFSDRCEQAKELLYKKIRQLLEEAEFLTIAHFVETAADIDLAAWIGENMVEGASLQSDCFELFVMGQRDSRYSVDIASNISADVMKDVDSMEDLERVYEWSKD